MKKVLIIGYFNASIRMASFLYVMHMKEILDRQGCHTTILDKNRIKYTAFSKDIIPVNRIKNLVDDYFNFSKIKRFLSPQYDLILLYDFPAYEALRVLVFCRRHKIMVGAISTEWGQGLGVNLIKGLAKWIDVFLRIRIINKLMDLNICCSNYFFEYYKQYNPRYLPTLADKGVSITRKEIKLPLHLIYIGIPSKSKENLFIFMKALLNSKLCHECHFDLYGLTIEEFNSIFNGRYLCLEQHRNVVFHGRVGQEVISDGLRNADFSVIFRERTRRNLAGFPTKMGTSISHGVPVLATPVGDIPLYIKNGENGLILPESYTELLCFLNKLYDELQGSMISIKLDTNILYWENHISKLQGIF